MQDAARDLGHVLGGWTIAPLFIAQSGAPIGVGYSESSCTACQAFGEATPPASIGTNAEKAVGFLPYTGGNSASANVNGLNGVATNNPAGENMFSNRPAIIAEFRRCILGYDTSCGGYGNIRGLPTWNLDASAIKDIGNLERRTRRRNPQLPVHQRAEPLPAGQPEQSQSDQSDSVWQNHRTREHAAQFGVWTSHSLLTLIAS